MRKLSLLPYIVPFAKLCIVPIMLWVISQNILNEYGISSLKIDPWLIFPAIIVNQLSLSLFALRMQVMLSVFGIKISQYQSLRIHLQSVFYFFVLPMTIGLEAARFAKVKSIVGDRSKGATLGSALLADRLFGAVAALLLAALLLPFMNFKATAQWDGRLLLVLFLASGGLILLLTLHSKVCSYIKEMIGLCLLGRRRLWLAMFASLGTHLFFAMGVYLASKGANLEISFFQTLFVISAAMMFVVFPISFAGISPVEAASLGALLGLGVPIDQAAVFVLFSYIAKLIAAFEGGGWEFYDGGKYVSRRLIGKEEKRS